MHVELHSRPEDGVDLPVLLWRPDGPHLAVSSAPLGGGIGLRRWVLNATVPMSYSRLDPDQHLMELAVRFGLDGPGVGLLTGVDVTRRVRTADGGVTVVATVGLGTPTWAAAAEDLQEDRHDLPEKDMPGSGAPVGTINILARTPVRLSEAALVNAVATMTEAKTQALWDLGVKATGTPTDAVCLMCPPDGEPAPFGGPRSPWGARLARAVYEAVMQGGHDFLASPWRPARA